MARTLQPGFDLKPKKQSHMTNLNLDVVAQAHDDERSARRIVSHFDKLAEAARRLSAAGSERSVRGIARGITAHAG